ncbi:MAG: outer membrane protein assembly factor BamA [Treponema sp.]|nr:outer membrane protein assembly factor BamA [Treponema sp.]
MRPMHRIFFCVLLCAVVFSLSLASQETDGEDPNWFWEKTISEISFEGLQHVKRSELHGITSVFIGQSFTEAVYTDLVDRLYALDMFEDIIPFAKHDPKTADKILLVFQVKERPIVLSVNFSGNTKLRNGELRDAVTVKRDDIFVEGKVLLDERALRDLYLKKGYTDAVVSHEIEETEQGIKVTFIIREGASTVIASIKFSGNTVVSERTLKSKISLKEVGFMKDGAFQRSSLEADKMAITAYYQDRGYVDVRVLDVMQEVALNEQKNRNELTLTFVLQEGPQYAYGGTTITGNEIFTEKELLSYIKLDVGKVFNQTKFQEGLQGITGRYAEDGYMTNQYNPNVHKDVERRTISFTINIEERPRSHIENIIIKGNTKTKDYVIRRELPLESGDIFSRDKVMQGLRNLYNLQYFSSVIPEPMPGSEADLVDLVITVEEQSTTTLEFGMTFSGVSEHNEFPISLFARWQNSNLRGEGRSVSSAVNISNAEQSVSASYGQNWLFNLPMGISESLSFSHSSESALRLAMLNGGGISDAYYYMPYKSWGVTFNSSIGRRWTSDFAILSLNGGLSTSLNDNIYNEAIYTPRDSSINQKANRVGLSNSIWASFSIDNRDINYDPSKGWFMSEQLAWYGLIPKLEKEFFFRSDTKLEGYATLFNIPIGEKWVFKSVLAAYTGFTAIFPVPGSLLGDSSKVYIDGMFNGRGWTDVYNTTRGKAMFSNRLEIRFPIFPGIIGVDAFFDAVAVKDSVKSMFTDLHLSDFYFSFGPGIRFLLPQFPLHLLWAWGFKYDKGRGVYFKSATGAFVLSFNIINK